MKKVFTSILLSTAFFGTIAASSASHPEGEWTNLGNAKYAEDLFTIMNKEFSGLTWDVPIEQSKSEPEWYRIAPYSVESAVTQAYGGTDPTWIYINTSDPNKVWAEDFLIFERYEFSQVVPEGGWKLGTRYATLTNNIISWPKMAFRVTNIKDMSEYCDSNTCPDGEMAVMIPGGEASEIWTVLGEAQFVDGIVSPLLTNKPSTVTVTVEERSDRPGYYRLQSPWSQFGEGTKPFIIDATDPDFVMVPFQEAGLEHPEFGLFMLASVGATWVHEDGMSKEEFIAKNPEFVITVTNGRIVFPENSVVYNFPALELTKFYHCDYPAQSILEIPGKSAGVTDVIASDENQIEEYFDLQGRKLSTPDAPGLYIHRLGDKVTKVIIR